MINDSLFACICLRCRTLKWLILLEQVHHSLSEVAHILTNQERLMPGMNLLIVYNFTADLIACPSRIFQVSKRVFFAGEHGHWYRDLVERELMSMSFLRTMGEVVIVVAKLLESILFVILSKVLNCFGRGSLRCMAQVVSKTILVVQIWV